MLIILILLSSTPLFSCSYLLPYAPGSDHRVLQGNFGKFSHRPPLQYGVDFDMNPGTYVHAARAGEVIDFRFDSKKGGPNKKFLKDANYLKIKHKDGTIAFYAHLLHQGVLVKKGQKIKASQVIAKSGCTGFCDGPHLHFEVYREKNGGQRHTIPVNFLTQKGIIKEIKRQKNYQAIKTFDENLICP